MGHPARTSGGMVTLTRIDNATLVRVLVRFQLTFRQGRLLFWNSAPESQTRTDLCRVYERGGSTGRISKPEALNA